MIEHTPSAKKADQKETDSAPDAFGDHDLIHDFAPEVTAAMAEAHEATSALRDKIMVFHRVDREREGVDLSGMRTIELKASESAAIIEWLEKEARRERKEYNSLLNSLDRGGVDFSKDLNADRLR